MSTEGKLLFKSNYRVRHLTGYETYGPCDVKIQMTLYEQIIEAACEVTGISLERFTNPSRETEPSRLRWALYYQMKQAGMNISQIKRATGKDRRGISHGIDQINFLIMNPTQYKSDRLAVKVALNTELLKRIKEIN